MPCPALPTAVYTLVKFARTPNYLVAVWTPHDMEACLDLNLPCADVR